MRALNAMILAVAMVWAGWEPVLTVGSASVNGKD